MSKARMPATTTLSCRGVAMLAVDAELPTVQTTGREHQP
jgi:hypothetical protein